MQILIITFPSKLLLPPDVAATCLSLSLSFKTLKLIQVSKLQPGVVFMGTKGFVFIFRKVCWVILWSFRDLSQLQRQIVNV